MKLTRRLSKPLGGDGVAGGAVWDKAIFAWQGCSDGSKIEEGSERVLASSGLLCPLVNSKRRFHSPS